MHQVGRVSEAPERAQRPRAEHGAGRAAGGDREHHPRRQHRVERRQPAEQVRVVEGRAAPQVGEAEERRRAAVAQGQAPGLRLQHPPHGPAEHGEGEHGADQELAGPVLGAEVGEAAVAVGLGGELGEQERAGGHGRHDRPGDPPALAHQAHEPGEAQRHEHDELHQQADRPQVLDRRGADEDLGDVALAEHGPPVLGEAEGVEHVDPEARAGAHPQGELQDDHEGQAPPRRRGRCAGPGAPTGGRSPGARTATTRPAPGCRAGTRRA